MGDATYSHLREHLAEVWDQIENTQEPVIVKRRGHQDLALVPADELDSLRETAHLLRSPANALRLLEALVRAKSRKSKALDIARVAKSLGLAE